MSSYGFDFGIDAFHQAVNAANAQLRDNQAQLNGGVRGMPGSSVANTSGSTTANPATVLTTPATVARGTFNVGAKKVKAGDPTVNGGYEQNLAGNGNPYYATLANLVNNPSAEMAKNPFFAWQQQQGEQAVNRSAAANGQLGSGNRMTALSDYAQNQSGQNFFKLADMYSTLGGQRQGDILNAARFNQNQQNINQSQQALDRGLWKDNQQAINDSWARLHSQPDVNPYAGYSFGGYNAT